MTTPIRITTALLTIAMLAIAFFVPLQGAGWFPSDAQSYTFLEAVDLRLRPASDMSNPSLIWGSSLFAYNGGVMWILPLVTIFYGLLSLLGSATGAKPITITFTAIGFSVILLILLAAGIDNGFEIFHPQDGSVSIGALLCFVLMVTIFFLTACSKSIRAVASPQPMYVVPMQQPMVQPIPQPVVQPTAQPVPQPIEQPTPAHCPHCQAALEPNAAFCGECGGAV